VDVKIAILGAGVMATALTTPLTDNGHEVALVGTHLDGEIIESIRTTGPRASAWSASRRDGPPLDEAAAAFEARQC
jgi:glycerol-3-phosphate dehydrogenase (NAD(P)+)